MYTEEIRNREKYMYMDSELVACLSYPAHSFKQQR